MTHLTMIQTAPLPTAEETTKKVEEAAYYSWLNRGRYAQPGNELEDWLLAEKELQNSLKTLSTSPKLLPPKMPAPKKKN